MPRSRRALLSDGETAALIVADGTIDWWCPGRFDADATFYRAVDDTGGALRVGPVVPFGSPPPLGVQVYNHDALVVRTLLGAGESDVEVVDLLPWRGAGHRAEGRIVRLVTARRGAVDIEVAVQPANRWRPARDVHPWSEGIAFDGIVVRTGCDMTAGRRGTFRLEAGERAVVTVDVEPADGSPLPHPVSVDAAIDLVDRTTGAWASRLLPLAYDGVHAAVVRRSLLVLLGLTYAPAGTLVRSLARDGRAVDLGDVSVASDLFGQSGLDNEAAQYLAWVTEVCGWSDLPLPTRFDVAGAAIDAEGDRALRLDVYGDLAALVDTDDASIWPDMMRIALWVADAWEQRDVGPWEVHAARHHVASKLACWSMLDRVARLDARRNPLSLDAVALRLAARDVVSWMATHGRAADGGLRSDTSNADVVDASLLSVAWRDPWPDQRWRAERTVDRVLRRLGDGPFVRAFDSSFEAEEDEQGEREPAASVTSSFAAVEALARLERWDEAHERMERLVDLGAPLGLLPSRVDLSTGRAAGDVPYAPSHLAAIRAAFALNAGPR